MIDRLSIYKIFMFFMYHASKVALSSVLTIAEYEVVNFNIANLGSLSHQNLEVNEALPISRE